ncbi:MAG TPA: hypothetical protein VE571_14940, partial [Solirubrobacteraceae bacterium]|nr:hypothetical protein [Solirubrobacteraceae bacterium]
VSCPSTSLCVATDSTGAVFTATNPTGGASAWTSATVAGEEALTGVSCPSKTLCVAVDDSGTEWRSTDPTGGAAAWTEGKVESMPLNAVACPSTILCVAVDSNGAVVTSSNPAKGAWGSPVSVDAPDGAPNVINTITCPSIGLCVAGDASGNVLVSTAPTGGAGAWSLRDIDGWPITGLACPPQNLCAAVDGWGGLVLGASSASTNLGPPGPPVKRSLTGRLVVVGRVKVVRGSKLRVRVACRGPVNGTCAGRLTLLTQTGKGRRRHKVGVGGVAIKLRGGRTRTITKGLDGRGRRLLRASHTLRVRMAITQGKRSVLNHRYTLRQPRPRKPRKHAPKRHK